MAFCHSFLDTMYGANLKCMVANFDTICFLYTIHYVYGILYVRYTMSTVYYMYGILCLRYTMSTVYYVYGILYY